MRPGLSAALLALLGLLASLSWAAPAHAEDDASVVRQTTLALTRALAYDRKLRARAGDDVAIAVLYAESEPNAAQHALGALEDAAGLTIRGLPVRSIRRAFRDPASLEEFVRNQNIDVVMICGEDLAPHLESIVAITREQDMLSVAPSAAMVRAGAALGAQPEGRRVRLYVNLPASREEGASFGAELLRLAEVIR